MMGHTFSSRELNIANISIQISRNDQAMVEDWLLEQSLALDVSDADLRAGFYSYLTLARWLIARAQQDDSGGPRIIQAKRMLDRLMLANAAIGHIDTTVRILILQSLSQVVNRNLDSAIDLLEQAIILAEPAGTIQPFVDEGPLLFNLLTRVLERDIRSGILHSEIIGRHTRKLMTAFAQINAQPAAVEPEKLIEPLTEREIEIVKLIAAGLSNQEIAERMILATSTIKWYIIHLYAKLATHNRTSAVARARELKIIT